MTTKSKIVRPGEFPVSSGFGTVPLSEVRKVSGLQLLLGMRDGKYPAPPISEVCDIRLEDFEEGVAVFSNVPTENFYNPLGTVHGGYIATLLDSALGCAVHTLCPAGYASTSVELKVNFVRPISAITGRVYARGKVIHPGRQLATSEAHLVDEGGKLFAHGTQTCSIFKLPEEQV